MSVLSLHCIVGLLHANANIVLHLDVAHQHEKMDNESILLYRKENGELTSCTGDVIWSQNLHNSDMAAESQY